MNKKFGKLLVMQVNTWRITKYWIVSYQQVFFKYLQKTITHESKRLTNQTIAAKFMKRKI